MRTYKLSNFAPGLNNRLEPTQLETAVNRAPAHYLYGADNVDINQGGRIKRRRGTTQRLTGRAHSIWGDDLGGMAVIAGELVALSPTPSGLSQTLIRSGMSGRPVSYSRGADGDVYWTDGVELRRVASGQDRPVAPATPAEPAVSLGAGALPAGRYLISFTTLDADGESAATQPLQLDVPDSGAIVIGPTPATTQVYVSGPNGDVLLRAGAGPLSITTPPAGARRLETLNHAPMPPGSIVRHYNGRMLVAAGNVLFYSHPYRYGLYDPTSGYIPLPAPITVVEPTPNGLYICADKTYWLADLTGGDLQQVLPYGGLPGSGGTHKAEDLAFWVSPYGLVVGDKNMAVKPLQDEALTLSPAARAAALYRRADGSAHFLFTRSGVQPNLAAAQAFLAAETHRKETVL